MLFNLFIKIKKPSKNLYKSIDKYAFNTHTVYCKEVKMKRRDLIKKLEQAGFSFKRYGNEHDIYARGENEIETIPRHREINEKTAKGILRKWGIK